MKTLSCRDAGVDCDFVAKGETVDEVIKKASEHVQSVHPEKLKEMMSSMTQDEIKAAMTSMVKDA